MPNILKYPGSKWMMAEWIVAHFPDGYENMTYLEPFFGSGAVFFTKNRSQIETINDLDDNVVNLFRVAREQPEELAASVFLTPWSRAEYALSYESVEVMGVEKARRFLVRMWQGIGAKSSDRTGWRKNVKGVNGNVPRFHISLPDNILSVAERLKHDNGNKIVQIENRDAFDLIQRHNSPDTLIYADPPYMLETRSGRIYKHEFSTEDHRTLLSLLLDHSGPVVLSGYHNDLYDAMLFEWKRYEKPVQTEAANVKTEVIWCNFEGEKQILIKGWGGIVKNEHREEKSDA